MTRYLLHYNSIKQATPQSYAGDGDSADDEEQDEPNEFRCLWKHCGETFDCQSQLVQHVNTEHIQKNKKDCSCYWENCTREEKPFKAMYSWLSMYEDTQERSPTRVMYVSLQISFLIDLSRNDVTTFSTFFLR